MTFPKLEAGAEAEDVATGAIFELKKTFDKIYEKLNFLKNVLLFTLSPVRYFGYGRLAGAGWIATTKHVKLTRNAGKYSEILCRKSPNLKSLYKCCRQCILLSHFLNFQFKFIQ
jgi:hypothetical protein